MSASDPGELWLLCRIAGRLCALPLAHVVETLRPPPIDPIPGAPSFVRGASVIRGIPQPVIDGARLLGGDHPPGRLVSLASGGRNLALLVDEVLRLERIPATAFGSLPSLFEGELVTALGVLDADLLVVLDAMRAVPDSVFEAIDAIEAIEVEVRAS